MRFRSFAVCLVLVGALLLPASAAAERLVAVVPGNQLEIFGPTSPSMTVIHPITGLVGAGEVVLGIDAQPTTGQLFLLGTDGVTARTYTVNPDTGAATFIGQFASPTFPTIDHYGYDFNPTADRIRVVSSSNQNLRLNPANGAPLVDATLTFVGPATGPIIAAAYDHNAVGGGPATMYDIDGGASRLDMQGGVGGSPSPNMGVVSNVGPLGVVIDGATDGGLDIASSGVAYAAFTSAGVTRLFTVNLSSGAATLVGTIGVGNLGVIEMTMAADAPPPAQPTTATPAPICQGKKATIIGTKGADKLTGTKGADVIAGLDGSDRISGLKGNDRICGGNGKDNLNGGPGKDRLLGDAGKDTLIGGAGNGDLCKGGAGHDTARHSCEKDPGVP